MTNPELPDGVSVETVYAVEISYSPEAKERRPAVRHEHLTRVAQVRGEEDDDRDLAELGRLEGDRAELDAEVGAVDLLADEREAREQQDREADGRDRVAVALEDREVLQQEHGRGEEPEAEDEPLRLLAREVVVDAVDHHEPEAGEHGDQREHVRIGVRQREADHQMRREAEAEEDQAVGQRDVRQHVGALNEDRREPGGQQRRRRNQRQQLAVACGH